MTEIWYSVSLSEKTYSYLYSSLQGLLRFKSAKELKAATKGLLDINERHFREFQDVWKRWLEVRVEGTSYMQKQRQDAINADPGSYGGRINYYNCIPQEHVPSAVKYMEKGVFKRTKNCSFAENPTLTGPSVFGQDITYCCPTSVLPFVGWDYVEVEKSTYARSLVTMFGDYIDEKLECFMEKLASKQVNFEIILGNCMNIEEFLKQEQKYDRILTSNLMDYILLPELLR